MSFLEHALKALPQVATSPLVMIAYVFTIGIWVWLAWRAMNLKAIRINIKEIPESQKPAFIREMIGDVIPATITPEQWIKKLNYSYIFYLFLSLFF